VKPVKGWGLYSYGRLFIKSLCWYREDVPARVLDVFGRKIERGERVVPVLITEIKPKKRKSK
jgi:hypothetical protein